MTRPGADAPAPNPLIVHSHLRWDFVWQRPQQIFSRLARNHAILFIEETGEHPYRLDRLLSHLRLAGVLSAAAGIAVGGITDTPEDSNGGPDAMEVIHDRLGGLGIPVAIGFPFGHIDDQWTLPLGAMAEFFDHVAGERLVHEVVLGDEDAKDDLGELVTRQSQLGERLGLAQRGGGEAEVVLPRRQGERGRGHGLGISRGHDCRLIAQRLEVRRRPIIIAVRIEKFRSCRLEHHHDDRPERPACRFAEQDRRLHRQRVLQALVAIVGEVIVEADRIGDPGAGEGQALLRREPGMLLDRSDPERVRRAFQQRFRYILVDEFQDTNPLQWQALHAWLSGYAGAGSRAPSVFIVGDPKQAIFAFRGTDPGHASRQQLRKLGQLHGARFL